MSPEQARGKTVDKRCGHLGVRLRAVRDAHRPARVSGETITDTIAAMSRVASRTGAGCRPRPARALRRLMQRCLEKDPKRRLRDIGDARFDIEDGQSARGRGQACGAARLTPTGAAGLDVGPGDHDAPGRGGDGRALRPARPAPALRVEITTPPTRDPVSLAISGDGQKIVFVATLQSGVPDVVAAVARFTTSAQPWAGHRRRELSVLVSRQSIRRIFRRWQAETRRHRRRSDRLS